MVGNGTPRALTWLYFVLAVGSLVACGIYIASSLHDGGSVGAIARAVIFGLLGILWVYMHGEGRRKADRDADV